MAELLTCPFGCGRTVNFDPEGADDAWMHWTPYWWAPKPDGSLGYVGAPICPECTEEHTYYPDDDDSHDGPILKPGHALPAGITPRGTEP